MDRYDSTYMELYALIALSSVYPDITENMTKGEHPDWHNKQIDLGLEVTIAQTSYMGYVKSLANLYLGKDITSVPLKSKKGFRGDFFTHKGKLTSISDSKGLVDGTRHIQLAIESATRKLNKLNSKHFEVFKQNCLFIYLSFFSNYEDIDLFCTMYKEAAREFKVVFSKIFLFDNESLFIISTEKMTFERYQYSDEQLSSMKKEALQLRKKYDWKEGIGFTHLA